MLIISLVLYFVHPLLSFFLLLIGTGFTIVALIQLFIGKGTVLKGTEVSLWKGFAKLVSWNPTEGVVFLKNKNVDFVDDNPHDGGGIRVVYPFFGEELVLKVPLEIQTAPFQDNEVLTKEYMPLSIKGTIYWKISDLRRFYTSISKEIHVSDDRGKHLVRSLGRNPQLEAAEFWLCSMAEEKTRAVISKIGTGLLISDQLAADLPKTTSESSTFVTVSPQSSKGYQTATEGLSSMIKNEFEVSVRDYGLEIHRVALQEVKLPPAIYAAAVDACKSAYLPLKAQAEALEKKLHLQAEADVIGKEATGFKEIARNAPALTFQEFLAPMFLDLNKKRIPAVENSKN